MGCVCVCGEIQQSEETMVLDILKLRCLLDIQVEVR